MATADTSDTTVAAAPDLSPSAPPADPTVDIMARLQALENNATVYRQGQITSLSPLSVTLGAGDTAYASVKAIDATVLAVNDVVAVLTFQHDLIILGRVGTGGGGSAAGSVIAYAGATVPGGFLLCDGSSQLRALLPALFTAIGTTWGSVDGTHFNLPNFTGRMLLGAGTPPSGNGATNHALGATGGEETHILTLTEMASHNHGGATGTGSTGGGTTGSQNASHVHNLTGQSLSLTVVNLQTGGTAITLPTSPASNQTSTESANHGHSIPGLSVPALTISSAGSGTAHNNLPPFGVIKWIIKT